LRFALPKPVRVSYLFSSTIPRRLRRGYTEIADENILSRVEGLPSAGWRIRASNLPNSWPLFFAFSF
ncbi:MAG: hypothetical protein KGL39_23400, partial [Patescibacteria group bacterium]|nr:hypothetical protein [Patescibacteria group bacterium]